MQQVHNGALWVPLEVVLVNNDMFLLWLEWRCAGRVDFEVVAEVVELEPEPAKQSSNLKCYASSLMRSEYDLLFFC